MEKVPPPRKHETQLRIIQGEAKVIAFTEVGFKLVGSAKCFIKTESVRPALSARNLTWQPPGDRFVGGWVGATFVVCELALSSWNIIKCSVTVSVCSTQHHNANITNH